MTQTHRALSPLREIYCINCHEELILDDAERRGEEVIVCPKCKASFNLTEAAKFLKNVSTISEGPCPSCSRDLTFDIEDRINKGKIKCPACKDFFYMTEVLRSSAQVTGRKEIRKNSKTTSHSKEDENNLERINPGHMGLDPMKNNDHILAIVKVIFDTSPSIIEHVINKKGEMFFREDEQDQLDLYNKQQLYTKEDTAEEARQCLLIPPLYFAATDPARKISQTQRYATLVKGLILTHNPIFLYTFTKMSFDNISIKNLDADSGLTITLGEMFLKYCKERTPLKLLNNIQDKIYEILNYSEEKAVKEVKTILKNFVYD